MYIVIGIVMLLFFLLGFFLGMSVPFFARKFLNLSKENDKIIEKLTEEINDLKEELTNRNTELANPILLEQDTFDEWLNGSERNG